MPSKDRGPSDWYHRDNVFPTAEAMARAHEPIVSLALELLDGRAGNVLDLGCGNGALLGKIQAGNPNIVPHGIEFKRKRLANARDVLPEFRENLVCGDIFSRRLRRWDDLRFALVLLAPRRLQQGGAEKAERLLAWVRPRCDELLIYGYGGALTEYGDLAGFAAEFGIALADTEPDVRVSRATSY